MSWDEPATARQRSTITRLCFFLRIQEPLEDRPMTRGIARGIIFDLRYELSATKGTPKQPPRQLSDQA